jgi:hypothetical protein
MNDEKKTISSTTNDATGTNERALEDAVGAFFTIGRMWASHGLRAAELALETSAATLRITAEALGEASSRIGERADD